MQLHDQGNSFAGVICGLGGGSLTNAGLMVSTPVRVKKDPRWPNEWHEDWESYETRALTMLDTQDAPVMFPSARALTAVSDEIEDSSPSPIRQTVNFISKDDPSNNSNRGTSKNLDPCVGCGNCMSGCPYNAKCSNDKNYIATAIEVDVLFFICLGLRLI